MLLFRKIMSKKPITRFHALFIIVACCASIAQAQDPASFVNPFIGTDNQGNTYPGAVAPFGSVQMTPNWAGNGYYYRNKRMHGFVVNHMSGDGCANDKG